MEGLREELSKMRYTSEKEAANDMAKEVEDENEDCGTEVADLEKSLK